MAPGLTSPTVEVVRAALKEVLDPEYPVSVVDLGLIRGVAVWGRTVRVKLTYCSLGCPATEIIQEDIQRRLRQLAGVEHVEIEEVFESWSREHITPDGMIRLRSVGTV